LLPHDDDALRLTQNAYHFGEFLRKFDIEPPKLADKDRTALLWGHCHHRATGGVSSEQEVLEQMGLSTNSVQGGCCGLAGSWGFEKGKYEISMDCGEQAYLPAVREADDDTVVVANGFSCQTQLEHAPKTDRRALHLGQVMQLARTGRTGERPKPPVARRAARVGALIAGAAAVAAIPAARAGRRA
jgi:Fe-S oxidoreductase